MEGREGKLSRPIDVGTGQTYIDWDSCWFGGDGERDGSTWHKLHAALGFGQGGVIVW